MHKSTDTHTGADSLMPVFFCQGCRKEGGGMEEREQAEDESRRRAIPIKNDSRQRTRQGTQRKKKYCWKRAKTKRILTGEELETKLNEALLRLADQGETGGQGWSWGG